MRSMDRKQRSAVALGTASALVLSLIGGSLVLLLDAKPTEPATSALAPIEPPVAAPAPEPAPESDAGTDLSMFGFGSGGLDAGALAVSDTPKSSPPAGDYGQAALIPGAAGGLPAITLPQIPQSPQFPEFPAAPAFDWNSIIEPLVVAQANAQSANVAGSVVGTTVGATSATLNSAAVLAGDLILYAALSNNGQQVLNELQGMLAGVPAAAALGAAGAQLPPPPDLAGLTAAFAAAAAVPPPLGVPALPPSPQLPSPDQVFSGLALSAAALPALGAGLQGLPPPPQLPRPEEVVGGIAGGIVALAVAGAVLGGIGAIFQPPSLTRMMGLPF